MGRANFNPAALPALVNLPESLSYPLKLADETLSVALVSMGNPHCVVLVDKLDLTQVHRLGPQIENHPLFPRRTNVQFVEVVDRHTLRIGIWERGAGFTMASGSSSCAAASAMRRLGRVDDRVDVNMPGGQLQITFGRIFRSVCVARCIKSPAWWWIKTALSVVAMPSLDLQEMLACQPKKYAHTDKIPLRLHFSVELSVNIRSSLIADLTALQEVLFVPETEARDFSLTTALLNKSDFGVSLPRSGLCFQAIRTLSGIPAFVILFSARTRAIAPQPDHRSHAASVNPRTAVLPGTSPFPLSSDDCNLLSISTAHYSRSFAD
ncbi:Diaminopimelate epimerase [Raoultella terrigena]|uniref:Diaminopimelate epimerase n=1 Tax=Raoultella terrigena TaxID=577 RepID=A0A4U9CYL6_RAOTE|nr:Diaminopimelate epimerase [Raoultella terrigena]